MAHTRKYQQPHSNSVSRELPVTDYQNPYLTQAVTAQYHTPHTQYPISTSIAPAMTYSSSTDSNSSTRTASSMISTSSGHQQHPAYYSIHHPTTSAGFTDPMYQQQRQASVSSTASPEYVMVTEEPATTPSKSSRGAGLERSGSRYVCMYPRCESSFSRSADLSRHYPTVHFPDSVRLNCPKPKCSRKGEQGFTRQDHLNEHLRQYHKEPVAKRRSSKSSAQQPETHR
ncbi:conserved hypothetical protein [Histoplasma capsulatum G186AR]|uniref:C2H2-type domain-containing protein n=2 Tax=Ajellomyces capsulatus TaxID=5037 RepID=C0NZE7_AJECG|nr:uncharacterized protein HCBG_08527 [Histoplasma capsulatum G186AR]EEH03195.1 conserved hypothetical protein [Histoplasma capsulatum G186AR]KAG5290403.1 putative C2H2 finger domain protein [Histoplasma capsulatum]QSS72330.1 C2H2 finger domain protein, putative [Histoplasma capsulatum G186AR]